MEEIPTKRRKRIAAIGLSLAGLVLLSFVWWWQCPKTRILDLITAVPQARLNLQLVTLSADKPTQGVLGLVSEQASEPASPVAAPSTQIPQVTLKLIRHPIAFSLYIKRPQEVFQWLSKDSAGKRFAESPILQSALQDALRTVHVRAEDLQLQGLQGEFLSAIVREIFSAEAVLHYDISKGSKGFVLSFAQSKTQLFGQALPVILRALARRQYSLAHTAEPIMEALVGEQTIFFTRLADRVFLSNGLAALLNVIEEGVEQAPESGNSDLVLSTRAEAFFDKLLPVMAGKNSWHSDLALSLNSQDSKIGQLHFSEARVFSALAPHISQGVLASIPRDTFLGIATSINIPADFSLDDWSKLASSQEIEKNEMSVQAAGLGVVWDFSAAQDDTLSNIGLIVSHPETTDNGLHMEDYFSSSLSTDSCAGETIWLASTSDRLLNRMREACERQSLSLLDLKTASGPIADEDQLVLISNLGPGLSELTDKGAELTRVSNENSQAILPAWKTSYLEAVNQARSSARGFFSGLPGVVFHGKADRSGAVLQGTLLQISSKGGE